MLSCHGATFLVRDTFIFVDHMVTYTLHMCYDDEVDDEASSRIVYLNRLRSDQIQCCEEKRRSVRSFVTRLVWIKERKRDKQTQFSVASKAEAISAFGCCSRRHACHVLPQCNGNTGNCATWCHKMGPATLIKRDPVCWIWSDGGFEIQPENFTWLWETCFPSTNVDLEMRCTHVKTNRVVASDLNHGRRVAQKKTIVHLGATSR